MPSAAVIATAEKLCARRIVERLTTTDKVDQGLIDACAHVLVTQAIRRRAAWASIQASAQGFYAWIRNMGVNPRTLSPKQLESFGADYAELIYDVQ